MDSASKTREQKFHHLSIDERQQQLLDESQLSVEDVAALCGGSNSLTAQQADHMIENVIGTFSLPLAIARNFKINQRDVLVPMAVEEPSVVAGVSFMARLARAGGGFTAHAAASEMIGQMQVLDLDNVETARIRLLENKERLLAAVTGLDPALSRLGGGARDLQVRLIPDSPIGAFLVLHLIYDVCDAMGANAVNTAVEHLAPLVEEISGGRVLLRILSNLADRRLVKTRCTVPLAELAFRTYRAEDVRDNIIAAWAFAVSDPYRAATHNKGIMNGVDAVVIATGNDWRAVEAGAHAYAARSGSYSSLSIWEVDNDGNLSGSLEMPMAVGIVGGATRTHPAAQAALKLMEVKSASQLAEIIVSVGLAQNLAALRALATEGIQRGHMSLHARQIAVSAGARDDEIERLVKYMIKDQSIRLDHAQELLQDWRKE